jgi:hypothetical protein
MTMKPARSCPQRLLDEAADGDIAVAVMVDMACFPLACDGRQASSKKYATAHD